VISRVAFPLILSLTACFADPSAERVYVGSGLTDEVFVLDGASGRILDTLALDPRPGEMDEPHGLAAAPDGRHWYATVSHGEPTLWKFEREGDRLVGRLRLGIPGAGRIGITPDGARAFIPDYWRSGQGRESQVAVVSLHDLVIEAAPTVCPAPHDAVVDPQGSRVAITCVLGDEVVVLDAGSIDVLARFAVGTDPGDPGSPRYRPLNLVWSVTGDALFVTLAMGDAVGVYDPAGTPLGRVAVGEMPTQLALSPDGSFLVVVNRLGGSLSVIDTETLLERSRIVLPDAPHPHGIALGGDGRVAYVSYEGTVESAGGALAVDLVAERVVWRTAAGAYALGVTVLPPPPSSRDPAPPS